MGRETDAVIPARVPAACAVCGETSDRTLFSAPDPDGRDAEPFRIARCEGCALAFVSPRPPESDLGRYYAAGYYDKPGEDSGRVGRLLAGMFMAERVGRVDGLRSRGRLLDVGCGEGTFLAAMSRRGWEAWGVEISSEGAARAAARPGLVIHQKPLAECALPSGHFDVITLWHSIEHVSDPGAVLREARRLLKDDGRLFLAFPNPESWDFKLFGARWFHLDPPRHLNYFSPETMTRLLDAAGFATVRVGGFSLEYNPFGFVQSVLNFLTGRMNYFYRGMKGGLPPAERSRGDLLLTVLLLPALAVISLPYTFLAAAVGASGCVDVAAAKKL